MASTIGTEESAPMPLPPNFDVYNQSFELLQSDGYSHTASTIDIDEIRLTAVRTAIVFATQVGMSAMLLLVLLLMTPGSKRRNLSWIFNVLALVCNVIRCTMLCIEMTGPFLNFVLVVMQEYGTTHLAKHLRISIAASVITTLVFIFIELALVTQVQVICAAAMAKMYRIAILTFCGIVAALAVGFRINLMIMNCQNTARLADGPPSHEDGERLDWAQKTSNVMGIVSICVFSAVFCTKLGLAIRSRRKLGLKQFGAMQIIFIMGCQTLTIPVIFAILDYYVIRGTQLGSFVETLVAIFLPLSSMWATTNVKSRNIAMPMNEKGNNHRAIPVGHSDFGTGGGSSYTGSKKQLMDDSTIDTLVNRSPNSGYNTPSYKSPTKHEPRNEPRVSVTAGHRLSCLSDGDEDLEMGRVGLGKNIHVDKSYTVLSEPDWSVGRAR